MGRNSRYPSCFCRLWLAGYFVDFTWRGIEAPCGKLRGQRCGRQFKEEISDDSELTPELDIGKEAEEFGYAEIMEENDDVEAAVLLKRAARGMKVRF